MKTSSAGELFGQGLENTIQVKSMESGENKALHATVEGRVQGVGFRYFVHDFAQNHALTGWVRNRGDDRVEVYAEGADSDLNDLLRALWRGPGSAMVSKVDFDWLPPQNQHSRFSILPSEY